MSEPLYQIIFRGKLLGGFTIEQVRANLAKVFRTDETRIGAMLAQPKWVIKAGVDKAQAQKIQEVLRTAGMMVAVMADAPSSTASAGAPAVTSFAAAQTQAEGQTQSAQPQPAGESTVPSEASAAEAPLAVKPKVPEFAPDLSAYSLADVGAIMDSSSPKKPQRDFELAQFTLAEPGVQIIEKKQAIAKPIDTSAMALVPAEPVKEVASKLWREFGE